VTSASPVYTRQGGTVTLQCPDSGGSTSWSVTSTEFIYTIGTQINPNLADSIKTRLAVTNQSGIYSLQISNVQLSDVREYRCSIGLSDTFYHLLLYIPPGFPKIENTVSVDGQNRTVGTENGSMTLTCNAFGGTPASNVSWIKDGVILVTSANTVQYRKVFTRADDLNMYTCHSSSPALTTTQTISVLIYLDLKPRQPTISGQMSQTENTDLQVVCESTGSRPAADIEWNVVGTWQSSNPTEVKVMDSATETYTVTSTLSLRVTRQDNGKSVYCRASNRALSGGTESERQTIIVLYPPDIHISYVNVTYMSSDRILTCSPDGNPAMYQFGQWRHTAEDGTVIRQFTGISSSTESILTLPDPDITRRYEDTGYYICSASNDIPVSNSYMSGSVFFVVEAPPVVVSKSSIVEGEIENSVSIVVEIYSRSELSAGDITWTKVAAAEKSSFPNRFVISFGVRLITTSFHGVDVMIQGYVAVLNINSLSVTDLGNYSVTIENRIGVKHHTVTLIATGPPSPPLYVLQYQVTWNTITVQWIRSSDIGQTESFVIGYRSDVTKDFVNLDAIPDSRQSVMLYTIEGLMPDTIYYIQLYAQNSIGTSDKIFLNCSTTPNCQSKDLEELISTRAALIVVTSILALMIVIIVAGCFIYRTRKPSVCFKKGAARRMENQQTRQDDGKGTENDFNQLSTYESINIDDVSPPNVYEDIRKRDQLTSAENRGGNTYEALGRKAAPNVYEELSKTK
ncbi:nephrin-like, partial [Ylistrum balloti]|uniref:nephrin-like n=1 Tax=Ylistrum balloti TaxID=509963 RepID=UPI0029058F67